jgi:tetratricopeptide (TPR) repeat protein
VSSNHIVHVADAAAAEQWLGSWRLRHPAGTVLVETNPSHWPFRYPLCPPLPDGPVVIHAIGIDEAHVNAQTGGTQLVTTQPGYLEAEWSAALEHHGNATLLVSSDGVEQLTDARLPAAFRLPDPAARLALCVNALSIDGRAPAALVATASACMEVNDFDAAGRDLDEAIAQAPAWAAAHYERGKLWLRRDDMVKAAESFQRAAERLPGFAPAWANLGGTLGELDRPQEALAAFERALAIDPSSPQALNNVGVVRRELGRLAESEAAFRQVVQLTPGMAFGHYNLGHTLFLLCRAVSTPPSRRMLRGRRATLRKTRCRRRGWRCARSRPETRRGRCGSCSVPPTACRESIGNSCWPTRAPSCGRSSRSIRNSRDGSPCRHG